MNFFRFCRWSLAALPVFLALMACDQLVPPAGGTGKRVEPIIRSVRVIDYNEASGTRSAAGEQKRIVGEPIVQDLGNGMLAEITVEEDLSALRATGYLADGVVFRAIAVGFDDKVYSWADYRANATDKTMDRYNGNLHVVEGKTYYYVYISYNNKTSLPDPPNIGDNITTVIDITAGSNDLMWYKTNSAQVNGVPELEFNFGQKFIRAKLTLNAGSGKTITGISTSNLISLDAPNSGKFNLKTSDLSNGSGKTDFTGWSGLSAQTATSGTFTFLPKATGDYILSWPAEVITVKEGATEKKTVAGNTTILNSKLKAGSSYTIALKFYRLPRFAGSNIYWDSANSRLTFDKYGNNTNARYQGVYFKWGSLIGIAAGPSNEAYNSSSTVLYKPTNTSDQVGTSRTWVETTGTDNAWSGSDWDDIPYYSATATYGNTQKTLLDNSTTTNFNAFKGDICYYIDEDYRMPTGLELDSLVTASTYSSTNGGFTHDDTDVPSTSDNDKAGKYAFTTNYGTLTGYVLPASGCRGYSDGPLSAVGYYGYYWSGSASSSSAAYELYFGSSDAHADSSTNRSYGQPVRCVLIE